MEQLSRARTQFHLALGAIFFPFVGIPTTLAFAFFQLARTHAPEVRRWGGRLLALAMLDTLLIVGVFATIGSEPFPAEPPPGAVESDRGRALFTPTAEGGCSPLEEGMRFPWAIFVAGLVVVALHRLGRRRGMDATLLWAGGLLLVVGVLTEGATLATCVLVGGPSSGVLLVGVAAQTVVLLLGGWVLFRRARPELRAPESIPTRPVATTVGLGAWYLLTGGFRIGGLLLVVSLLIGADPYAVAEAPLQSLATSDLGPWGVVLFVVPVAVLAPLSEELLFRGILLPWLSRWMPAWGAVAVSGVLFGALHFHYGLFLLVTVFYGLVLGWARVSSRSLRAPILLHMLINGVGSVVLLSR